MSKPQAATKRQTYTVRHALPFEGRICRAGEQVTMHPRQAKYLLGTHLERPAAPAAKPKRTAKPAADGGSK